MGALHLPRICKISKPNTLISPLYGTRHKFCPKKQDIPIKKDTQWETQIAHVSEKKYMRCFGPEAKGKRPIGRSRVKLKLILKRYDS